jgi:hypothetical protein
MFPEKFQVLFILPDLFLIYFLGLQLFYLPFCVFDNVFRVLPISGKIVTFLMFASHQLNMLSNGIDLPEALPLPIWHPLKLLH